MLEKITECEKRIAEDKKELDNLIRELYEDEHPVDEYINYKIRYLKNEIATINQELAFIQKNFHKDISVNSRVVPEDIHKDKPQYETRNEERPHSVRKDLESVVGKNLMGVFASVLIFISLVLFAALIYPYLNDTVKMIVMFGVSFLFLIIGLLKIKKDRENKLYQSVTGCGLGAVYISLLISSLYFGAIGDIALYVLIALWAIFICILSGLDSGIFQTIGQIGICIAVIFGVELCVHTEDIGKFIFLILFFIATSIIFIITHFKKQYDKNIINNVFNVISSIILFYGVCDLMPYGDITGMYLAAAVLLFVYVAANLIISYIVFEFNKQHNICLCIVNGLYTLTAVCLIPWILNEGLYSKVANIIFAVLLFIANDIRLKNKKDAGKLIYNLVLLIIVFFMCIMTTQIETTISLVIFIIPLLVLGFIKEDFSYKVFALIYTVLFWFNGDMNPLWHMMLGLSVVGVIAGLMIWKRGQYDSGIKNMSYVLMHLYILKDLFNYLESGETLYFISFIVHSMLNIAAMKTDYSKNWFTKEKERNSECIINIINGICMFISLFCIDMMENEVYHIICILVALGLFLVNSKNLLQKYDNIVPGVYIGIKCTVLITVIAYSFDASDYALSIVFFITSIVSIVPGFVFRYKSLRIYGLVLAILSIIKLTLIDIVYDSTIERALSFFICGILCFVISIIYNRLDKKFLQG